MIVTKMRTVPTFLAHITARAGPATQEMGAFVMVYKPSLHFSAINLVFLAT